MKWFEQSYGMQSFPFHLLALRYLGRERKNSFHVGGLLRAPRTGDSGSFQLMQGTFPIKGEGLGQFADHRLRHCGSILEITVKGSGG